LGVWDGGLVGVADRVEFSVTEFVPLVVGGVEIDEEGVVVRTAVGPNMAVASEVSEPEPCCETAIHISPAIFFIILALL
jgi:hypothetical protein